MSKPVDEQAVSSVRFADPPGGRRKYDWRAIARRLRRRPMAWALIFEDDRSSVVNAIRQGSVKVLAPERGFELMTRHNRVVEVSDGKTTRICDLYLRYNPDKDEETG